MSHPLLSLLPMSPILLPLVACMAGAIGWLAASMGMRTRATALALRAERLEAELAGVRTALDASAERARTAEEAIAALRSRSENVVSAAAVAGSALDHERLRAGAAEARLAAAQELVVLAKGEVAGLEAALGHERSAGAEKLALLDEAQTQLKDAFSTLSRQALDTNAKSFLELAAQALATARAEASGDLDQRRQAVEHLVQPMREELGKVTEQLRQLELTRTEAYAALTEQVVEIRRSHGDLRRETANLVTALRTPHTRGRWGELQLRRVVELAGMVAHCDFDEQPTVGSGGPSGTGLKRPDLVVKLPGERRLVVDAKVPLSAYLAALDAADDGDRTLRLRDHARQVRHHIDSLAAKAYWSQFQTSPDFVVLFIPGEAILSAACEHDPDLFEHGFASRVLLATPSTLIALLKSAAYGWRQEAIADNARKVSELGRMLYERLSTMGEHVSLLGRSLEKAVDAYNKHVGSLEGRVLVTARRLADLDVAEGELVQLEPVELLTRKLAAPELLPARQAISAIDEREAPDAVA